MAQEYPQRVPPRTKSSVSNDKLSGRNGAQRNGGQGSAMLGASYMMFILPQCGHLTSASGSLSPAKP